MYCLGNFFLLVNVIIFIHLSLIIQYVADPSTLLYFGMEFSMTRRQHTLFYHSFLSDWLVTMQSTRTQYLLCKVFPVSAYINAYTYRRNGILLRFNARKQLREKLEEPLELKLPTNVLFGQPESQNMLLMRSNPFSTSASAETKYSEYAFSTRGAHYWITLSQWRIIFHDFNNRS